MSGDQKPVVLRCENECVAVPIQILIKESDVFKAMLSLEENRHNSFMKNQEEETNDSEEDSESAHHQDKEEIEKKKEEIQPDSHVDHDKQKIKRRAKFDSDSNIPKKLRKEIFRPTSDIDRGQFDIINITGFQPKAVKTLFEYLKGYPELMEKSSYSIRVEMLAMCDLYVIESPIIRITSEINNTKISFNNVIDAINASSNLLKLDYYQTLARELEVKIFIYLSKYFNSWDNIVDFILKNKSSMDSIAQIFKKLQMTKQVYRRFSLNLSAWFSNLVICSPFVLNNMLWSIQSSINVETSMVEFNIKCHNPSANKEWTCKATLKINIFNFKSKEYYSKSITEVFNENQEWVKVEFMGTANWNRLGSCTEKDKYFKDGEARIVIKITVHDMNMDPDLHGIPLEELGWEDTEIKAWKKDISSEMPPPQIKEMDFCSVNMPVVLNCDGYLISIPYSLLIKESTYFESKFSVVWNSQAVEKKKEMEITDKTKMEIEVVKITGYNSLAVRALFDFLQGYKNLLDTCDKFSVLVDMLKLSDFYGIQRPIKDIIARMNKLPIDLSNLVDALEFSKKLEIFEFFKEVPPTIVNRCITYARGNLFNWQTLMKLVVDNNHRKELVVGLLEEMCEKKEATIRMRLVDIPLEPNFEIYSNYFIFDLFKWRICISAADWDELVYGIEIEQLQEGNAKPTSKISCVMKILNQDGTCYDERTQEYLDDDGSISNHMFMTMFCLTNEKNGFMTQDRKAFIELNISTD